MSEKGGSHLREVMKETAKSLTARPAKSSGVNAKKLPAELQLMSIGQSVTDSGMVPLHNCRLVDRHHCPILNRESEYLHVKRCCGHCRGFRIRSDEACRCINEENYSTSCRCVSLSDNIFATPDSIGEEALKSYWKKDTFFVHRDPPDIGAMCEHVRLEDFKLIQRLVIDTRSFARGRNPPQSGNDWMMGHNWPATLAKIGRHAGPELSIEMRFSTKSLQVPDWNWDWDDYTVEEMWEAASNVGAFKKDVERLGLRVRALVWEQDGTTTTLLDCRERACLKRKREN